ncbi:pericentrin isoform X3 [Elephas maximus indicus]|uniref:pericentrin isoform X3 n=1 Tax=Elephas maximus indicus TaxID=99487 RepID=UPI002116CB77|nr:pericentrin isoform X3 [Elephas maximus indicus]
MEEDEQEQRRRKVEAGRAKLAHFQQRKAKGDGTHSKKKTAKRKGSTVDAPVPEESPVAAGDGGLLREREAGKGTLSSDTPEKIEGALVAQACEQGHELEVAAPTRQNEDETAWLRAELQQVAAAHEAEMQQMQLQTQSVHALELEALRLSLSNMHTAQLELTQANLQKEKEAALTELREMLNGLRAQELALAQSRQQSELARIREQHEREREVLALQCGQEAAELKEKLESEVEKNVQIIETLKRDWESERELCLENLRKELSEKHQSELENLQNQFKRELAEQKAELEKIFQAKNQAECALKDLETQHEAALQHLREELQSQHCQHLEDLELKCTEKEKEKQLELEHLQASYEELKAQSQEEIKRLWSQLDSLRASRQGGQELDQQLLAPVSRLEELEQLKRDFEQRQQREKTEHEADLEQLRIYFEKKLRDAEKNYQEDLTLLQQRLQEVKEDSFLEYAEISPSSTFLEETAEKERKEHLDQLKLQLEQHEESLMCLQAELEEKHRQELEVLKSSLEIQHEEEVMKVKMDLADKHFAETQVWKREQCLELERLRATLSGEHVQELTQMRLQHAQDVASEVETEVAARVLGLENEYKVKLSLLQTELKEEMELLKIENRNLHEKLQHEIHLREDAEKAKCNLVEDHQEEVRKTKEKVQLMRQELKEKEEEWKVTREDLKRKAEEKLTLMLLELREKTESEKQAIIDKFELRETEMRQLQGEQATQILELARSLAEQQSRLQQLELGVAGDEPPRCSQCGPAAEAWERTTLRLKEDCALQLMLAQNRFLEERKQMMEKFAVEHDTTLQVLQEKHMGELQLLQDSHRQRIVSLTAELQAEHQAEMGALKAALESEQRALLETRVAELQTRQTAELSALEVKHLSNLDSLESCYLSAIQILRDEHRQALKQLSTDLEEQLRKKDSFHQIVLTQELEKLKLKHDEELQGAKDSLRIEMSTKHVENLKAMAAELQRAHQEELAAALHAQRRLLEKEKSSALDRVGAEVVLVEQQHQTTLREPRNMHVAEVQLPQEEAVQNELESGKKAALQEKEEVHKRKPEQAQPPDQKEEASLSLRLQEKEHHIQQLKDQITSLSNEIEECHSELEKLQQRRERENQEGTNLISMLKSDIDLSHSERNALQDALRRLLSLFGETVRAAVAIKSQISERVGLCLDDVGATGTESPPKVWPSVEALCAGEHTGERAAPTLDEALPGFGIAPLEPDGTLLESAEVSVVAEISSHVCESFFMSPEATLEYEQPIRKVYQSLRVAVNSLLEMALDSSRQLEEAHQIHARFEKEFNYKNEETAQVIRQQKELLDCLSEESSATAALTRELHQAHGLIEGFKEERADLQVALDQKEQSEQCLVLELEHLSQQLQAATQEQAQLKEECAALQSQKEVLAAGAQEREAGLRKEVECLMKEQLETRKQSEKDRAALLSQLQVLESELEEQVSRHQACAQYADEVVALKQQMASLDKHLRSQRQFMDEQAAEREHERDEFQQEIQRLEEQLRRAARPQATGARDSHSMQPSEEVELLQEKLREKSDGFNELAVKKELADRRLAVQQEEIQSLEVAVAEAGRRAAQLQEELEMQRRIGEELQQDKEALQKQQMNHLILVSALQTELEEAKCRVPPVGSPAGAAEAQPEAVLEALPQHVREVLDLKEQLEELKDDLASKNEEILHLTLKLDVQARHAAASLRELQEENAHLKAFLQNKEEEIRSVKEQLEAQPGGPRESVACEAMGNRSPEVEELKSIIGNLQENQARLQKEKAEEIEQLHEVIEKLQKELSPGVPVGPEIRDSPAESLRTELERGLLGVHEVAAEDVAESGPHVQALQAELEMALAGRAALGQLLEEREQEHRQALEALGQSLRATEEAATRQLAGLRHSVALKESALEALASRLAEFEDTLREKEALISEKDLEISALSKQRAARLAELEAILVAVSGFRCTLERQPMAEAVEPPELQVLRAQCTRLNHQLQTMSQQFLLCQRELDRHQARREGSAGCGVPTGAAAVETVPRDDLDQDAGSGPVRAVPQGQDPQSFMKDHREPAPGCEAPGGAGLLGQQNMMSVLAACQKQLASELLLVRDEVRLSRENGCGRLRRDKRQEKPLKDGWLQKVDLLTQVKQLQERLARLVHSVTTQDTGLEGSTHSQPLARVTPALENSLSSVSCSSESTDRLTPADTSNTQETTWGVTEVNEHLDVLTGTRTSNVPIREKMEPQGSPFSLKTGLQSSSEGVEPVRTPARAMDLSWGSPEVVRRDSSLEPPLNLPLTPCSDATGLSSPGCSLLQADDSGLLCYPVPTAKGRALPWVGYPLAVDTPLSTDHHHVERTTAEKDVEDFIITSFDSQENLRSSPLGDGKSDGSEKSDGSGFGEILNEGSERIEAPPASPAAPLQKSGKCQSPPVAMKEREVHAKQVQALLKMVCDESHHILALSEYRRSASTLERGEPCAPLEHVPGEGPGLMEAAPALRGPQKGEKELSDVCVDWRGVFLRAVQDAFEKERHALGVELQSRLGCCEPGDGSYLLERLERVVQEQGALQEPSAESLCLSDRSSLLSEIQALRAQLRMTHLQNQEKLQQLCAALTSAEARGSRQEHQLRRQVELLAYKVEQEKCIASDLQKTLSEEQEKATSVRKLLVLEQNAVKDLKSELCECKQENERLLKSLNDVQKEVLQLRSMLDSKEKDLEATLEELEAEHEKERALQSQLEEEQLQHLQREGQSSRALEELRASLEKQCAQNNRLCVALKHEQTAKDNLQKELQIECSRCEALLGQERSKLAELQKSMQAEQGRSRELSEALAHERLLTEQLSQRVQEASLPQALLQKLGMEQARVAELQVLLERVQQQAVCAQQRLEAEVQMRSEEIKREREVSASLEATVEALQTQKQELRCSLEKEREKPAQLKAELEQLHVRLREQDARKERRRRAEQRQSRADAEKCKTWQRDKERLRELELQRQRDEHKIEQLQRTVRDLQSREDLRPGGGLCASSPRSAGHTELCFPLELSRLREQQEQLEKVRQQLLCATGLLTSFIHQTVNRTINDWTSSNEKAVASLLQTLEELKSDLSTSTSSQKNTAPQLQIQLVDVLLKDNDSLRKVLSTVTQEKAELCKAVSKLEKTLKHHVQKGCALSRPGRAAWKHEKMVLQGSPRHTDPGPRVPAASEEATTCSIKMEKLYLHYLRAESFRKALIYQKKYLLLLIGGFQDSEQETLSMIAHLGVFPSKADKKATASRPFTKFRTAVRVVVAILRLRFLVRKWQEVDRKGTLLQGRALRPEAPLSQWQPPLPETRGSPPTRDASSSLIRDLACGAGPTPTASPCRRERSTPSPNSRSERSLDASQDPEQSLTEYIHHLEVIQQRLGGIPPESTSKKSSRQKIK